MSKRLGFEEHDVDEALEVASASIGYKGFLDMKGAQRKCEDIRNSPIILGLARAPRGNRQDG